MRRLFAAFAGLLVMSSAANADVKWSGPGWYQITEDFLTVLYAGPFANEQGCMATLPKDYVDDSPDGPGEVTFRCQYLAEKPDYARWTE